MDKTDFNLVQNQGVEELFFVLSNTNSENLSYICIFWNLRIKS